MSQPNLRVVERDGMDRGKALEAALGQIERAFGKGSIMRLGQRDKAVEAEVVSTGSIGLDIGLGIGGLPRGWASTSPSCSSRSPTPASRRWRSARCSSAAARSTWS